MAQAVGRIEMGGGSGVVFSFDLSASIILDDFRDSFVSYLNQSSLTDVAIVSHSDYTGSVRDLTTNALIQLGTVAGEDYPFKVDLPFASIQDAIDYVPSLYLRFGGNGTESYTRVIWEMTNYSTVDELGGVPSALVMFVDDVPHGFPNGYENDNILDPGPVGDSALDTEIPYSSPIYFDQSANDLAAAGCDLIVISMYGNGTSFWSSRVGSEVTAFLDWNGPSGSGLADFISFLNNVL